MNFVVCIQESANELVGAECAALTGISPDADGFALVPHLENIHRAAYLRFGARWITDATLDGLLTAISHADFPADDFRIELTSLPGAPTIHDRNTVIAVADVINAYPDLTNPKHRFALVVRREGFWFGEILAEPDRSWERHDEKPYRTSSSLPSRLSRALVNLVAKPGCLVLDPCCGTGSILLEAVAIGAAAKGADWNPRMVGMSQKNLAHFGYDATVEQVDARSWNQRGNAVVTDLPYGKNALTTEENLRDILRHAATLAPKAVYVAGEDISDWLREAGYDEVHLYHVPKRADFARYVHVCDNAT